jgi:hypothetical protein
MKLLLLVVPREARDGAEAAIASVAGGSHGFTEVPGVYGEGRSGPRFASRTAPEVSDLVFAVLRDEDLPAVKAALGPVEAALGRRLRAFVLPVEEAWSS